MIAERQPALRVIEALNRGRALPARAAEGAQHPAETPNVAYPEDKGAPRIEGARSQGEDSELTQEQNQNGCKGRAAGRGEQRGPRQLLPGRYPRGLHLQEFEIVVDPAQIAARLGRSVAT